MNFLKVFCVVLCIRSGAFLHIQNNVHDIRYKKEEDIQVSAIKKSEIPINPYDDEFRNQARRFNEHFEPQINPEYVNSQQIKNNNEHLLNEEYTGNQGLFLQDQTQPKFIYPPVRSFNDPKYNPREDISKSKLQENIRLESSRISPNYLNWQQIKNMNEHLINQEGSNSQRVQYLQTHPEYIVPEIKGFNEEQRKLQFSHIHEPSRHSVFPQKFVDTGPVFTERKNVISQPINHLIEAKHMPEEDKTLELQTISPEYINSFINKDKTELNSKLPLSSPYENVKSATVAKYLDNQKLNSEKYFKQQEATYDNPSAEVLYTTKRALPYEIEEQQIPKISQGGIGLFNNQDGRKIQDIQKLLHPLKRYMIIHPDGRVEHVDEIEKITKTHPNYVMIKSHDFLKQIEGKRGISGLQIPQLFAHNLHDSIVSQNRSEVSHHPTDIPSDQKSLPQFVNNPLYTKVTDSVGKLLVSNEPRVYPTQEQKTVKVNLHTLPENSKDENILFNKEHLATHLLPDIENHEENNNIRNKQTITQLTPYVKENEYKKIESTSVTPSHIQQIESKNEQQISAYDSAILSSTIATITEKNYDNFNKSVVTKVNNAEKASLPFVNLTFKGNLPISPHNRQIILNNASEQTNLNTLLAPKKSTKTVITDINIKNLSQTVLLPILNRNKTDIGAIQLQNSNGTMSNGTVPNNTQVFYKNPETLSEVNPKISNTLYTRSGTENDVISINTSEPSLKETSLSKNSKRENINKNDTNKTALNITSQSTPLSNIENRTNNTGFWFQADEQFWQNIMSKNDTRNLFYFFFVPSKTNIIQRETKTTLYPNGTTIEEVSETIDEDGVPKVIKTTKVFLNSTSTDA